VVQQGFEDGAGQLRVPSGQGLAYNLEDRIGVRLEQPTCGVSAQTGGALSAVSARTPVDNVLDADLDPFTIFR
jgi:hypothetical protein